MLQSAYWLNFCWTKPRDHKADLTATLILKFPKFRLDTNFGGDNESESNPQQREPEHVQLHRGDGRQQRPVPLRGQQQHEPPTHEGRDSGLRPV